MVMKDAIDGSELTRLDLTDLERRYGFPYMVIHRSDLHGTFLRACQRLGSTCAPERPLRRTSRRHSHTGESGAEVDLRRRDD